LKITDEEGKTAESLQKIRVETPASAPIAVIKAVPPPTQEKDNFISGSVPFEVNFDATGSQDPDRDIVEYSWDFDGDGKEDSAGETATYIYKEEGSFNATLTVADTEGNESVSILIVRVEAQPLTARITADPFEGIFPLTVTFDASSSSYPDGQIVGYEWDFGDGTPKRVDASKVIYKYTSIGTYTASVTALASDGTKDTAEIPINIRPVSLSACFETTPETGPAPLELEFNPSCSTGTVINYKWDFGDGKTTRTRKPRHTYNSPGTYSVELEVSDNQNVIDTFTKTILVTGEI
jgi:PKD repeat protein